MSFLYGSYFTTIIVYCLFYFFNSFHAVLPWTYCHEDVDNKTTLNWWASDNCTDATMNQTDNSVPVTQDYFDNFLLHKTSGIEEVNNVLRSFERKGIYSNNIFQFGSIRWELFGLLILTWVLIYFFVFRGTKSIGKIVWFTAIFPYVMLTALLIRGCTLTGAMEGIEYFLGLNGKGDWSKLKDIQVWVNATSQIFNSIGIGFGSLITFSSFNRQNKTILRDTLFIATINRFGANSASRPSSWIPESGFQPDFKIWFQFDVTDVWFHHFLRAWSYISDGWPRYHRISNART